MNRILPSLGILLPSSPTARRVWWYTGLQLVANWSPSKSSEVWGTMAMPVTSVWERDSVSLVDVVDVDSSTTILISLPQTGHFITPFTWAVAVPQLQISQFFSSWNCDGCWADRSSWGLLPSSTSVLDDCSSVSPPIANSSCWGSVSLLSETPLASFGTPSISPD